MDEQMGIKRVPYYRKPKELTVEEWQAALRKQYSLEQKFKVTNSGSEPLYSDYEVYNPETNKTYKVSIRDNISSFNYCSCPDFRVNTLLLSLEENVNVDSVKALVYGTLLIYNGSIAFAVTGLYMASIGYAILATNALPKWIGWFSWYSFSTCILAIPAMYGGATDTYGCYNVAGWGPTIVANIPPLIWVFAVSIKMIQKGKNGLDWKQHLTIKTKPIGN